MPTCDDYQLSFEMQLHGAAPVIPTEEITAHIASCTSCTAYVATTEETATMNTANWTEHDGFDAARLLARVRAEIHPTLRDRLPSFALAAVLGGVTFALIVLWDFTPSVGALLGAVIGVLLGGGVALVVMLRQRYALRRHWAQLANAPAGDLIAARKSDLATRRKRNLAATAMLSGALAVFLATGDLHALKVWVQTGPIVLIVVISLVQDLRDRRELRELGK